MCTLVMCSSRLPMIVSTSARNIPPAPALLLLLPVAAAPSSLAATSCRQTATAHVQRVAAQDSCTTNHSGCNTALSPDVAAEAGDTHSRTSHCSVEYACWHCSGQASAHEQALTSSHASSALLTRCCFAFASISDARCAGSAESGLALCLLSSSLGQATRYSLSNSATTGSLPSLDHGTWQPQQ